MPKNIQIMDGEDGKKFQVNVITNWNTQRQTILKPPIGLMPEKIHNEERINQIDKASERYKEAGFFIPDEWVIERYLLIKRNAEIEQL